MRGIFATKITDPLPHGMSSVATRSGGRPAMRTAPLVLARENRQRARSPISKSVLSCTQWVIC